MRFWGAFRATEICRAVFGNRRVFAQFSTHTQISASFSTCAADGMLFGWSENVKFWVVRGSIFLLFKDFTVTNAVISVKSWISVLPIRMLGSSLSSLISDGIEKYTFFGRINCRSSFQFCELCDNGTFGGKSLDVWDDLGPKGSLF